VSFIPFDQGRNINDVTPFYCLVESFFSPFLLELTFLVCLGGFLSDWRKPSGWFFIRDLPFFKGIPFSFLFLSEEY